MKYILTSFLLLLVHATFSQSTFPSFLKGTWKQENTSLYEHWDSLNPQTLKGFSYILKDGNMKVSEYLDLSSKKNLLTYTATVVRQNGGKSVSFKQSKAGADLVFENPVHDFPKKLVYKRISDSEIQVEVSDGKGKGETFKMFKQGIDGVKDTGTANPKYDKELALKLGSDDYGMKSYILAILKTGTNPTTDKNELQELFRGHMNNINRLVEEGKLVVAGPLGKNDKTYRGIFILKDVGTIDAAKELLQTDPAVKAGVFELELYNWYGSAALPEYLPASDKIWKVKH
ncbi:Uncharacterized conserved protein YciI, contains a putative active-site phosphohistidine [Chitinophaga sp. YR627]|uniref:DUF6265 family protein n=1 Tax=Chitinophaga sp. YR627 TaxID=1881041 RepID=UPI0008F3BC8B|nr:DUF6265 family protein [Chitinophaga sp. YR627]SFM84153.1 Uncharacterized conserved protein YciI, contains a putative active-site phosphohistidine [Chitinophaga sp. YR627]